MRMGQSFPHSLNEASLPGSLAALFSCIQRIQQTDCAVVARFPMDSSQQSGSRCPTIKALLPGGAAVQHAVSTPSCTTIRGD